MSSNAPATGYDDWDGTVSMIEIVTEYTYLHWTGLDWTGLLFDA